MRKLELDLSQRSDNGVNGISAKDYAKNLHLLNHLQDEATKLLQKARIEGDESNKSSNPLIDHPQHSGS